MTGKITLLTIIIISPLLLTPALATANECLNDDPDTDVEWVSSWQREDRMGQDL